MDINDLINVTNSSVSSVPGQGNLDVSQITNSMQNPSTFLGNMNIILSDKQKTILCVGLVFFASIHMIRSTGFVKVFGFVCLLACLILGICFIMSL